MRIIIILCFIFNMAIGQTFTYSGYIYSVNGSAVSNFPLKIYKRTTTTTTTSNTSVKIFKTHAGNGSTNQYAQYPMTRVEMDKLFNTTYSNTTLWWSGSIPATSSLNFYAYTTLTSAGASVPTNGDFYSTEVTFTFTPKETGTYTFGLTSDDGGDLYLLNYGNIIEWYGGKGVGQYVYGSVSLIAGSSYTFIARMQEYQGGDGLVVYWKRPSQSGYSLQTDEIGTTTTTTSAWTLDATVYTNTSGFYSISRPSGTGVEFYIQLDAITPTTLIQNSDIINSEKLILNNSNLKSWHWSLFDVNGDGKITISDSYSINKKKWGNSSTWPYTLRFITPTQYNLLNNNNSDQRILIPGISSITINNPISGTTNGNYYIITPGLTGTLTF